MTVGRGGYQIFAQLDGQSNMGKNELGGYGGYDGEYGAGQISEVYIDKGGPNEQYWSVEGGKL